MPQTGPMARARWSALLAGSPRLHTAFSLESVADELCFVIGPAAVTVLATQLYPAAGVGTAALCALAGSLWFASQRSTEPPVVSRPRPGRRRPAAPRSASGARVRPARRARLAAPGLVVLIPVYLFIGAMFVAIDLSTVAFAAQLRPQAAGRRDPRLLRARQRDGRPVVRLTELARARLAAVRGHPLADRGRRVHVLGDA